MADNPVDDDRAGDAAQSARWALRSRTRDEHDAVDAAFSGYDLTTLDGYAGFLTAQARAFAPVERALEQAGAAALIEDWPKRRRAAFLAADLADLGVSLPVEAEPPAFLDEAEVLGGAYVLEGSRLGGALLARSLPADAPARFMAPVNGEAWRRLIERLDARLAHPCDIDRAVAAARSVFRCFHRAAQSGARA